MRKCWVLVLRGNLQWNIAPVTWLEHFLRARKNVTNEHGIKFKDRNRFKKKMKKKNLFWAKRNHRSCRTPSRAFLHTQQFSSSLKTYIFFLLDFSSEGRVRSRAVDKESRTKDRSTSLPRFRDLSLKNLRNWKKKTKNGKKNFTNCFSSVVGPGRLSSTHSA